jgi:hypothetical protein
LGLNLVAEHHGEFIMPVLIVNGLISGEKSKLTIACRCEWCGESVTREGCRPVCSTFDGDFPPGVDRMAVLTRMCQDCINIYCALATDGLVEAASD